MQTISSSCAETRAQALEALERVKAILNKLQLSLHPEKTRIVRTEEEGFDFLGFHFHKCVSRRSGKLVPFAWPSTKAMTRIRSSIKGQTSSKLLRVDIRKVVPHLNRIIRGWRNYFGVLNGTRQLQTLDTYVWFRMLHYYRRKMGNRGSVKRDLSTNGWAHAGSNDSTPKADTVWLCEYLRSMLSESRMRENLTYGLKWRGQARSRHYGTYPTSTLLNSCHEWGTSASTWKRISDPSHFIGVDRPRSNSLGIVGHGCIHHLNGSF